MGHQNSIAGIPLLKKFTRSFLLRCWDHHPRCFLGDQASTLADEVVDTTLRVNLGGCHDFHVIEIGRDTDERESLVRFRIGLDLGGLFRAPWDVWQGRPRHPAPSITKAGGEGKLPTTSPERCPFAPAVLQYSLPMSFLFARVWLSCLLGLPNQDDAFPILTIDQLILCQGFPPR